MEITVLIYNVCGVPWPLGCGKTSRDTDESGKPIPIECFRSSAPRDIGDKLAEMRSRGTEPDIIMLQEAFISTSAEIPGRGGYANWVAGSLVSVSPFQVEAVFDEPQGGFMPSDHNGLLVHYRLSWPVSEK